MSEAYVARTFKRLYPKIYDFENLWWAWRRARRGGKRKWPTVASFEVDLELDRLRYTVRLCHEVGVFSLKQYRHASGLLAEVGRLAGKWLQRYNRP